MGNRSLSNREWQIRQAKKGLRVQSKRKPHKKVRKVTQRDSSGVIQSAHTRILVAPTALSLIDNFDETIQFFDSVISAVKASKMHGKIHFDLSAIDHLTMDAVMYIIAIITNMKRVRVFQIQFGGNTPNNSQANEVLEKSGFYKFVFSNRIQNIRTDADHIQITSGIQADGPLVGQICDFVHKKTQTTLGKTKRLFPMILELMTNTYQHAYKENTGMMKANWYIAAEGDSFGAHFSFLDTGVGIPETIAKKFPERLASLVRNNDAELIASALRGDTMRTETKKAYRGKGLPQIYEDCVEGKIKNLLIISGRGICKIFDGKVIETRTSPVEFAGTLFSWDIV